MPKKFAIKSEQNTPAAPESSSRKFTVKNDYQGTNPSRVFNKDDSFSGSLDEIIQKISSHKAPYDTLSEKILILDTTEKVVRDSKPWFSLNEFRYYRIRFDKEAVLKGVRCNLKDTSGKEMSILINCELSLIKDRHSRLTRLLLDHSDLTYGLKSKLIDWVKEFCNNHSAFIEEFYQFESPLESFLKDKIRSYGFQANIEMFPTRTVSSLEHFNLIKHQVECEIKDWKISVLSTLAMNLVNPRKYQWADVKDLENWTKRKLEQIIQSRLLEYSYSNLLLNFVSYAEDIRVEMNKEAVEIGYEIKQLLTSPQLQEFTFLDGFRLNTDDTLLYNTKDPTIKVRFRVDVQARLNSLHGVVERYLKPGVDLLEIMKNEIQEECRLFVQGIDPQRFYIHFSSSFDSELSFENELTEIIRRTLIEKFNVVNSKIIITPESTDLSDRFQKLQEGFCNVHIQTFDGNVKFDARFKVDSVHQDGWYRFKANNYTSVTEEKKAIAAVVKSYIETNLNNLDSGFKEHKSPEFIQFVRQLFTNSAEHVTKEFGLIIHLSSLDRQMSRIEKNYLKSLNTDDIIVSQDQRNRAKQAQIHLANENQLLKTLYAELSNAEVAEDEDRIEELTAKIAEARQATFKNNEVEEEMKALDTGEATKPDYNKMLENDQKLLNSSNTTEDNQD